MNATRLLLPLLLATVGAAFAQSEGSPAAERQQPISSRPTSAQPPAAAAGTTSSVATDSSDATRPGTPSAPGAGISSSRVRALSPELNARLAERMPRYNPPPPPSEPTPEEVEAAQPKNQIIRLPEVVVRESRPPVFTDRELHTKQGLAELAMNRYLSELDRGLNRWTIPLFGQSPEQRALAQYAEDERLRNLNRATERANLIEASEGADAAQAFRETTNDAFIRSPYLPQPSSLNRD